LNSEWALAEIRYLLNLPSAALLAGMIQWWLPLAFVIGRSKIREIGDYSYATRCERLIA